MFEKHSSMADLIGKDKKAVFFDLGANIGLASENFINQNFDDCKVFLFEPNVELLKAFITVYAERVRAKDLDIEIYPKIAWIDNKFYDFSIGNKPYSTNSRMKKICEDWNLDKEKYAGTATIQAVDISGFIKEKCFELKDYVCTVKMDIEGSEWEVCKKMLEDGTFEYIDHLFIEFHGPNKIERGKSLISTILNKHNIVIYEEAYPGSFSVYQN